ncbi:hypothetical protein Tco_0280181, partial [Tanacetum coccineum]
ADPSKSSLPPVFVAPMVSFFLCSEDSESDTEIPERHVSPTTSTPEIPTAPNLPAPSAIVAPSSEFPLAPVVAPTRDLSMTSYSYPTWGGHSHWSTLPYSSWWAM